jgi:hypothetical protein
MNRNDSFEVEKVFLTELQNGKNLLKESSRIHMENTLKRQQMVDLQMPSFIRGDEHEDAADLF